MTPEQIDDLLARKVITPEEADALRDVEYEEPPQQEREEASGTLALLFLLLLLRRQRVPRRLSLRDRNRLRDELRETFEGNIAIVADALLSTGNAVAWYGQMYGIIADYQERMLVAGLGRAASAAELQALGEIMARQDAYLRRFVRDVQARQIVGRPLSRNYVANRSRRYGGQGWGLWYQGNETGEDVGYGYVSRWISRDDIRTCSPCGRLHNTFTLVGRPPFPGMVCLGAGLCRCDKIVEYNLEEYLRLI